jgi:ABC-2 type transport system permease protein
MSATPTVYFQHLRWHLLRNSSLQMLKVSWLRLLTIIFCSSIIWCLLFFSSWRGFFELKTRWEVPLDLHLIELVFDLMFFTLALLLTFSTGIILYSSLFSSAESAFLMAAPVPDDHIFAYKFQGAVAFSSWAFVLLGSPVLIAYGIEVSDGAPWYFFAALPLFFFGFVLMPGAVGAMLCLVLVNLMPRHRWQAWVAVACVLALALAAWSYYAYRNMAGVAPRGHKLWFESLLGELAILDARLVPFHWVARGLRAAAIGNPGEMAYQLGLVWSNGLFAYLVSLLLARRLFRRGYNRVASGGTIVRRYGSSRLDELVGQTAFFLEPQTRLLLIKDFRTFRRDPAQWFQVTIFLGLAAMYFFNMRRFYEQDLSQNFKNVISILTTTATSFLMCAYTGRFIFPMLSLEGRKFWILGLLPMDRAQLLWGKFAFSACACILAGEFLILFSNLMLSMPWLIICVHAIMVIVLSLGLSGLSVGLGACLPNFRETDPSKIAVGFGGTLNLVAGLLLLILVIFLIALPMHYLYASRGEEPFGIDRIPLWTWAACGLGITLGLAAAVLPLRAGVRQLQRMEF